MNDKLNILTNLSRKVAGHNMQCELTSWLDVILFDVFSCFTLNLLYKEIKYSSVCQSKEVFGLVHGQDVIAIHLSNTH